MTELYLDASRIRGGNIASGDVLLCGEDNPLSSSPHHALYHQPINCAGHRLQSKILGVRPRETYLGMWRTNLCVGGWDRTMAQDRAALLAGQAVPWSVVVMLGVKVAGAFAHATRRRNLGEPFAVTKMTGAELRIATGMRSDAEPLGCTFVALPHPSGRNTLWNLPENIDRARAILREAMPTVPWGELP